MHLWTVHVAVPDDIERNSLLREGRGEAKCVRLVKAARQQTDLDFFLHRGCELFFVGRRSDSATTGSQSLRIQEQTVNQFHRQKFVNRRSMILAASKVAVDDGLHALPFKVGPGERSRIEQHLADVIRKACPGTRRGSAAICAGPERDAQDAAATDEWSTRETHCGMP